MFSAYKLVLIGQDLKDFVMLCLLRMEQETLPKHKVGTAFFCRCMVQRFIYSSFSKPKYLPCCSKLPILKRKKGYKLWEYVYIYIFFFLFFEIVELLNAPRTCILSVIIKFGKFIYLTFLSLTFSLFYFKATTSLAFVMGMELRLVSFTIFF